MPSADATTLMRELIAARRKAPPFELATERVNAEASGDIVTEPVGTQYERVELGGVPSLLVEHPGGGDRTILFLHGGAYTLMSANSHRRFAAHLALACASSAVLPDYRLAPEHPFPAAIDDSVAVAVALLHSGVDPETLVIAGDSAGGGLALAVALRLRELGRPQPALLVLLCPWLDLTLGAESLTRNAELDAVLDASSLPFHVGAYLGGHDVKDPLVSPLFADLDGLAPMYVQAGEHDILVDDAMRLARRARVEGGDVALDVFPEMCHSFQFFAGIIPEADAAIAQVGYEVRRRLRPANPWAYEG